MEQVEDEQAGWHRGRGDFEAAEPKAKWAEERSRLAHYIQLLLESTDEGIYGLDIEGRCILMNKSAAGMFGYEPDELQGRELHPLMHHTRIDGTPYPQDDCPIFRAFRKGQGTRVVDEVFWRRDGTSFPVEYSSYPIKEDGVTKGAVVTFSDITERKLGEKVLQKAREELEIRVKERTAELAKANAELQLEINERKRVEAERERLLRETETQRHLFRTVVEKAPAGIAVLRGPDFVFELANPAYQAIAPGKVLLGRTVAETWPELAPQVIPLLERVFQTAESYSTVDAPFPVQRSPELPIEEVFLTFSYVPLLDPEGRVDAILVLVIETTQHVHSRKLVEKLAAVAQHRAAELQAVLDNMVDAVYVCDGEGRITLANEAALQMLGMDRPEEAKRALAEFPELLRVRFQDDSPISPEKEPLARALAGETVIQVDRIIFNQKTRQDVYLRISAAPIKDDGGKIVGAVGLARDVTKLTELDRQKDQFISTAAHELKTPLTLMKGYSQALLKSTEGITPSRRKALEGISHGVDRINALTNDLLDLSRLHMGSLEVMEERVNLAEIIELVVDRMDLTTTRHQIRIVKVEPVIVRGDGNRLEQVLINLLDNAIRFSPGGGNVDVAMEIETGKVVVSVRDYGIGIPEAKQGQIFQRFYRAHEGTPHDYGGMGVGLYISKEIITRHNGQMWFESEVGKGSTFYFSLPLHQDSSH